MLFRSANEIMGSSESTSYEHETDNIDSISNDHEVTVEAITSNEDNVVGVDAVVFADGSVEDANKIMETSEATPYEPETEVGAAVIQSCAVNEPFVEAETCSGHPSDTLNFSNPYVPLSPNLTIRFQSQDSNLSIDGTKIGRAHV